MKVAINKVIEFNGEDGGHVLREARTVPLQEHEREREVWLRLEKKKVNGERLCEGKKNPIHPKDIKSL